MNSVYTTGKCMCGALDCRACYPQSPFRPVREARRIAFLEALIGDIYAELEEHEDAERVDGQVVPNFAMRIRQRIDEAAS